MTDLKPFNPVDHMDSDEEIIEFLVDCYDDDPDGRTYERACEFVGHSQGIPRAFSLIFRATREIAERGSNAVKHPQNRTAHATAT